MCLCAAWILDLIPWGWLVNPTPIDEGTRTLIALIIALAVTLIFLDGVNKK
jgi:hypothetical protein